MTTTRFRIEVPGLRTRTATSLANAEVVLGNMLTDCLNGTRGSITRAGEQLLVGEAMPMGWVVVR